MLMSRADVDIQQYLHARVFASIQLHRLDKQYMHLLKLNPEQATLIYINFPPVSHPLMFFLPPVPK